MDRLKIHALLQLCYSFLPPLHTSHKYPYSPTLRSNICCLFFWHTDFGTHCSHRADGAGARHAPSIRSSLLLMSYVKGCASSRSLTILGDVSLLLRGFRLSTRPPWMPDGSRQLRSMSSTDCEQKTFLGKDDSENSSCTMVFKVSSKRIALRPCQNHCECMD